MDSKFITYASSSGHQVVGSCRTARDQAMFCSNPRSVPGLAAGTNRSQWGRTGYRHLETTPETNMAERVSRRTLLGATAGASLAMSSFATANANAKRYGIHGRQAPELLIKHWIDASGNETTLDASAMKDKWVFLKMWQSWCPGCHRYGFPTTQKLHAEFGDNPKLLILGIQTVFEGFSINTKSQLRKMQLRYDLPIPMGHDAGEEGGLNHPITMMNYRTGGTPWLVLINPEGVVIFNDFRVNDDGLLDFMRKALA